jgi:hypothetical protein
MRTLTKKFTEWTALKLPLKFFLDMTVGPTEYVTDQLNKQHKAPLYLILLALLLLTS